MKAAREFPLSAKLDRIQYRIQCCDRPESAAPMSKPIPLIRAAALFPMLAWMRANGRPTEPPLRAAQLGYVRLENPFLPIPVYSAIEFFRQAALTEGPDFGCRITTESSLRELGLVGLVALSGNTPREGIARVIAMLPYHCSHEHMQIHSKGGNLTFIEGWSVNIDCEAVHIIHQFVASLVLKLCRLAEPKHPAFLRIEMTPHPRFGLDHLHQWFGATVHPSATKTLTIEIAAAVADQAFRRNRREVSERFASKGLTPLNSYESLSACAHGLIIAMLADGVPTVENLAWAAGTSLRTLQRRLAEEGTSFSELLEAARRELALSHISNGLIPLNSVSETLGFARQSALTRAVHRWTGQSPSALRKRVGS